MRRLVTSRTLVGLGLLIALGGGCGGEEPTDEWTASPFSVEQWRALCEKHFKYQHVTWALNIIKCESSGNPDAYNASSGASGLFQHLKKYWDARAAAAGFAGASPFEPEANIAASAYLLYAPGGGTKHWVCKYSPFEDFGYQPQFYKDGQPLGSTSPSEPPPEPPPSEPPPSNPPPSNPPPSEPPPSNPPPSNPPPSNPPTPQPPQPCTTLPVAGGVIDEGGSCFELNGPTTYWHSVEGQGHMGGLLWTNATQQATAGNWARWKIQLAAAGRYTVQYYAVDAYARSKVTRYVVRAAGKETTLTVDQSVGGTGWRTLGTFNFAQGGGQHVSIYDNTTSPVGPDQHIVVDAIKLFPAPPQNTPPQSSPPAVPPADPNGGGGASGNDGSGPAPAPTTPPGTQGQELQSDAGMVVGGCSVTGARSAPDGGALLLALGLLLARRRRAQGRAKAARRPPQGCPL